MKFINKTFLKYGLFVAVLIVSFIVSWLLPTNEIFKGILAVPGVAALFLVLYQSLRDNWLHERTIEVQNKQQDFILSTSSHIAEVSYNKHVLFCEDYIDRVQKGRKEILKDGSTPETMNIGADLVRIRQKHSAWLTDDIENRLKPFENALIKIGAGENYLRRSSSEGIDDKKREKIDDLYRSLGLVLGHERPLNDEEANVRIDAIIDTIRDILGIKAMTQLRLKAMEVALKRLEHL